MKYNILFAVFILLILIFPGAMAANITITAEPLGGTLNIAPSGMANYTVDVSSLQRNAIQRITVDVPTGSTVDYTLWYGNGTTLSGHMIYNAVSSTFCGDPTGLAGWCQFSEVSIGSSVSNHYYVGAQEVGRLDIVGYGRNEDTQERVFIIYDLAALPIPFHLPGDAMAFTPVPYGVIYKFNIVSNKPMTSVNYYTNTRENVEKASNTSLFDVVTEWWNIINQIKDTVIRVFWFFYYGFQFFWDNIILIMALYLAITGAMAANGSKDIFTAIAKFFRYQQKLLEFLLNFIDRMISFISRFIK